MGDVIDIFTKNLTKFGKQVKDVDLRGIHSDRDDHIREAGHSPEKFKEVKPKKSRRTLQQCTGCDTVVR